MRIGTDNFVIARGKSAGVYRIAYIMLACDILIASLSRLFFVFCRPQGRLEREKKERNKAGFIRRSTLYCARRRRCDLT